MKEIGKKVQGKNFKNKKINPRKMKTKIIKKWFISSEYHWSETEVNHILLPKSSKKFSWATSNVINPLSN